MQLINVKSSRPRHAGRIMLTALLACVSIIGLAGCATPGRLEQVERGEKVESDSFLNDHLQKVPMATVGEAYRAVSMLVDGEDKHASFEEREADLQARGIARKAWNLKREDVVDKGTVAYMVLRIIKAPRGVNSLTLGALGAGDRRYALRDMIYLGLMEPAASYRTITGGELAFLVGKADAYMAEHKAYPEESMDLHKELQGATSQPVR